MFQKLFYKKYNKLSFEDIQYTYNFPNKYIILNTLPHNEQEYLIKNTIYSCDEESVINNMINMDDTSKKTIIIYGKNNADNTTEPKYDQLTKLGFFDVFIYNGGLFEWLLLQDIYGKLEFPTTKHTLDILKYKPPRNIL
jgi:hypothetical protein